jgi:hypothetical protein
MKTTSEYNLCNVIDVISRKNYGDLLKQLGVLNKQGKIEPVQKEIIGIVIHLYSLTDTMLQRSFHNILLSENW